MSSTVRHGLDSTLRFEFEQLGARLVVVVETLDHLALKLFYVFLNPSQQIRDSKLFFVYLLHCSILGCTLAHE